MNLLKKKELAIRALKVGKDRIVFNKERLDEIKEAITKQDIKDLVNTKAIIIKNVKGRRKLLKRKTRIRQGSRRKKIIDKKREYIIIVRKLRKHLSILKNKDEITKKKYLGLRQEIRAGSIRSLVQLKERIIKSR